MVVAHQSSLECTRLDQNEWGPFVFFFLICFCNRIITYTIQNVKNNSLDINNMAPWKVRFFSMRILSLVFIFIWYMSGAKSSVQWYTYIKTHTYILFFNLNNALKYTGARSDIKNAKKKKWKNKRLLSTWSVVGLNFYLGNFHYLWADVRVHNYI